ncbi:SDR family oxidoreductase [Rubripirellula amarantea]|nr:SDR family oxidoreductase [Rubripirellula amarantea]
MTSDLKGKSVLVTGANRGIGKAILEEAIQRGATKVYAAVRDVESAKPLVSEHGNKVVPVHLDLDDPASIVAAADTASDVDIVINNAGVMRTASAVSDDAIEALQFELNANVFGLLRVAKAFAPVLKANGGGTLAQLNSVASLTTFPEFATYCASKAASYSITQALRESLRDQGTHIVSVHPGPIQTDMGASAGFGDAAASPTLVAESVFDAIDQKQFFAWPDPMAEQVGAAYQSFAENVIESGMQESLG